MQKIDRSEIVLSPSSFVDPSGRLFFWNDRIFRGVFSSSARFFDQVLSSDTFRKLLTEGKVVPTWRRDLQVEGFDLILEHERIPFESYCCEWCSPMLQEAGRLLIDILLELAEDELFTADGHPWNILFDGTRPVFVDVGSMTPADPVVMWPAYNQFCNFFLHPLYLGAASLGRVARAMSMDCVRGIESEECRLMLPWTFGFRYPSAWSRIYLPAITAKLCASFWFKSLDEVLNEMSKSLSSKVEMKNARKQFFKSLLKLVMQFDFSCSTSHWTRYYDDDAPDDLHEKKEIVADILTRIEPSTLLDVGCNTGVFALMAAEKHIKTIAIDSDESCVSILYSAAKDKNLDILPLVIDVLNYTPLMDGWENSFRPRPTGLNAKLSLRSL